MKRALPLAIAALLVLGACSDDGDDGSGAAESTTTVASSSTTADTTADPADPAAWCAAASELNAGLTAFQDLDPDDPAAVEDVAVQVDGALHDAVDAAPAEIRSDVETVATAFLTLFAALAAVEYDFTQLDTAVLQSVQAEEQLARLDEYNADACGLTSPTVCRAMRRTLQVAVEAYFAEHGEHAADEQALVDAGLIDGPFDEYDVGADGTVVASADSSCG